MTETSTADPMAELRKLEKQRQADYRAMVVGLSHDRYIAADKIDSIATAARKTVADVESDASQIRRRLALRKQFEAALEAGQRLVQLREKTAAIRAAAQLRIDAIHAEMEAEISPLAAEAFEAQQLHATAHTLQIDLFRGCADKALTSLYREGCESLLKIEAEERRAHDLLHFAECEGKGDRAKVHTEALASLAARKVDVVAARDLLFLEMLA